MATVDASIPLSFQPSTPMMSPMQAQTQALSMRDLMANSQLNQMRVQQGQMELRNQMLLSQMASNPQQNLDPETGFFNKDAIAKITEHAPQLGMELNQKYNQFQNQVAERKLKNSESAIKSVQAKKEVMASVYDPAVSQYEDDIKNGVSPKDAQSKYEKNVSEGIARVKESGEGGFTAKDALPILPVTQARTSLTSYKERKELENKADTPIMKEAAALYGYGTPQFYDALKKHIAKVDAPSATTIKIGEQAKAAEAAKKPMDETAQTALDIQAWNYMDRGTLPYRKGSGGGADRNDAAVKRAAELSKTLGMTPQEVASMPAEWKANAGSMLMQTKKLDAIEGQLSSFHNNLDTWDSIAKGIAPKLGGDRVKDLAKDLKKIDFTGIRSVDDVKLKIEQQFNDPTASALAVSAMAAAMDYGRIMQGPQSAASLTESVRKDAERLIVASADEKGRKGIMAALESDTEGQVKGQQDQLQKIRDRMGGKQSAKSEPAKAKPTAADTEAVAWAKANPNDPRAKRILEHNNAL